LQPKKYIDTVREIITPPLPKPGEFPGELKTLNPMVQLKRCECEKKDKRVYMRVHIGDLTEDEVRFIGVMSYNAYALCVFRRAADISLETAEENLKHSTLLERFEAVKAADRGERTWQQQLQITSAMSIVKLAAELSATRKRAWGYSLTVGNIPGLSIVQSSPAALATAVTSSESGTVQKDEAVPESAAPLTKTKKKRVKSVNPKPQNPTTGVIHDALVALFHKKPKAVHWSAEQLAETLKTRRRNPIKCTASGVKATQAWHKFCKPLRRREKTVSWENAGQIEDNQSDQDGQDEPSEQSETDQD
jgi:hypothetical protein